jgi:hypothetical protein
MLRITTVSHHNIPNQFSRLPVQSRIRSLVVPLMIIRKLMFCQLFLYTNLIGGWDKSTAKEKPPVSRGLNMNSVSGREFQFIRLRRCFSSCTCPLKSLTSHDKYKHAPCSNLSCPFVFHMSSYRSSQKPNNQKNRPANKYASYHYQYDNSGNRKRLIHSHYRRYYTISHAKYENR